MDDAEETLQLEMDNCRWDVFIEEVLPRLSTKDLRKFQTVCKNWYRIIRSPYFVKLRLNVYNQSRIRIFRVNNRGDKMISYKYKYINSDEGETEIKQIPVPVCGRRFKILGSCDGLLCLFLPKECKIGLYNPSTGKYFSVPICPPLNKYGYDINCSWFGCNPSSGEYVLALEISRVRRMLSRVGIYKFSRSNLELVHSTSCCILLPIYKLITSYQIFEKGTLLHGALHWPGLRHNVGSFFDSDNIICVYHLDDNRCSVISPPVQCDFKLGVAEGCLMAIFKVYTAGEFELWIMREYGNEQSWTKYADILGFKLSKVLTPLGYFPNGDLILDANKHHLFKYSFADNTATPLTDPEYDSCFFDEAIMYDDSLVAPTTVFGGGVE